MPTWVEAMLEWVKENRPNDLEIFKATFESGLATDAIVLMAHIGFEAGRKYQQDNPDAELEPLD